MLNHAASHPAAPPSEQYVRAEVLMGASIIQPVSHTIARPQPPGGMADGHAAAPASLPANVTWCLSRLCLTVWCCQVRGDPNKCVFTTIAHINPGGLVPPFVVNTLCARGPVEFHTLVEQAAKRTKHIKFSGKSAADKYGASPTTTA